MNEDPKVIRTVLKDGPVLIPSLIGAGVDASYPLWQGITAAEFYPSGVQSAFYQITLEKEVIRSDEASVVEQELCQALKLLAKAWPFSGGSFMQVDTLEELREPRFQSNALEVKAELLAHEGSNRVVAGASFDAVIAATYRNPPLRTASMLAQAMLSDFVLDKLLEYHQNAWVECYCYGRSYRAAWFMHLYKIRDGLSKFYNGDAIAKQILTIPHSDWVFFGSVLNNNDLRHADITGMAPAVPSEHVDRLYRLARSWICAHLVKQGLPVTLP